jgi:hypothetical protein
MVKHFDNNGDLIPIAEVLAETNAMLQDIPWTEANEKTSHLSGQRASEPAGKTRRYNRGVTTSVSALENSRDVIEMLEDYSFVDEWLIEHSGNGAAVRTRHDLGFLSGMSKTQASRLLYGNNAADEDQMTGLSTRMSTLNSLNIVNNGGSGADVTSIYMVQWGLNGKVYGIYPTGAGTGGIMKRDNGRVQKVDSSDRKLYGWETQFDLQFGLVVEDPRCIARVANIETAGAVNLFDWEPVIDAQTQMRNGGQDAIAYVSRKIWAAILKEAINKPNNMLTMANVFGDGMIPTLNGMPVRLMEAISETETATQSMAINAAANAISTNVIQLPTGVDWKGNTIYPGPHRLGMNRVLCKVDTKLVAAVDGAVLTVAVYTHSAATSIDSGTLLASKDITVNIDGPAVGTILADLMLPQDATYLQYLGVDYSVATQNISSGAVDCMLVKEVEKVVT